MRRVCQWFVAVWLVLMGTVVGEELSTAAYVMDRGMFRNLLIGEWGGDLEDYHWRRKPVPVEAPAKSRFFGEGDELSAATEYLREAGFLEGKKSWGVYNKTTGRLVVRGSDLEQLRIAYYWRDRSDLRPHLGKVRTELFKVRCTELGAMEWSEEELKRRGGESLVVTSGVGRLGGKFQTTLGSAGDDWRVEIEAEVMAWSDYETLETRLAYVASKGVGEEATTLRLGANVKSYQGTRQFRELGDADEEGMIYLLMVGGVVLLADGTPVSEGSVSEDETAAEFDARSRFNDPKSVKLETGLIFFRFVVPPTFPEDFVGEEEADPFADPFADAGGGLAKKGAMRGWKKGQFPSTPEIEAKYFHQGDKIVDLTEAFRNKGVALPEAGWAVFHNRTGELLVLGREEDLDLVDILTEGIDGTPPTMVSVTLSLVETKGGELVPGKVPEEMERFGRMAVVGYCGRLMKVSNGRLNDEHEEVEDELIEGMILEVESMVGASGEIIDFRYDLRFKRGVEIAARSGVTLSQGRPLFVPLGMRGGRRIGVVMEARQVDQYGKWFLDDE